MNHLGVKGFHAAGRLPADIAQAHQALTVLPSRVQRGPLVRGMPLMLPRHRATRSDRNVTLASGRPAGTSMMSKCSAAAAGVGAAIRNMWGCGPCAPRRCCDVVVAGAQHLERL